MSAAKCLYCDMILSRQEREEGWCDSCGKRLPDSAVARPSSRAAALRAEPVAPAPRRTVGQFFAIFGLACVFGVIGALVAGIVSQGELAHAGGMAGAVLGGGIARAMFAGASEPGLMRRGQTAPRRCSLVLALPARLRFLGRRRLLRTLRPVGYAKIELPPLQIDAHHLRHAPCRPADSAGCCAGRSGCASPPRSSSNRPSAC